MTHAPSDAWSAYRLDGMILATNVLLPNVEASSDAPDWRLRLSLDADACPEAFQGSAEETGRIRDADTTWCVYERAVRWRRVRLADVLDLAADSAGREAVVRRRDPGSDPLYLVRRAVPYLSALRKRLTLHAGAVVVGPGSAVLLCGGSGAGKSTLALAADARGLPVLADDHVVLTADGDEFRAEVSLPFADVGPASRNAFRPDVPAGSAKSSVPLRTPRPPGGDVVRGLLFLDRGPSPARRSVAPSEALVRLLRDVLFVGDPADRAEHAARLDGAVRLTTTVPAWDLIVPDSLDALARRWDEVLATLSPRRAPQD